MKKWYQSKTIWVNALLILGGVLSIPGLGAPTGTVAIAGGVINVLLRTITSQPISSESNPEQTTKNIDN